MKSKKRKEPKDTVSWTWAVRAFSGNCSGWLLLTLNVLATHSFSRLYLLLFDLEILRMDCINKVFLYIHFSMLFVTSHVPYL